MSGLDKNMLLVIECLAKNRIQDAKKAAIACCANDTTKKNQRQINYCKNLLNIGSLELTTLPCNQCISSDTDYSKRCLGCIESYTGGRSEKSVDNYKFCYSYWKRFAERGESNE